MTRMNTKFWGGNLFINTHLRYHKGEGTMTLIGQSIHHLLYILHIHIRFNKHTGYLICHQIIKKYTIYMPYQNIPFSNNGYINTLRGIYTINVKSVHLEQGGRCWFWYISTILHGVMPQTTVLINT